jgi:hypothetical protein
MAHGSILKQDSSMHNFIKVKTTQKKKSRVSAERSHDTFSEDKGSPAADNECSDSVRDKEIPKKKDMTGIILPDIQPFY